MNQLKVVANDILPIYETGTGEKLVNARELHQQLFVGKVFAAWIQDRIEKYGFNRNEDFFPISEKTHNGRPRTEYLLTMDTAKEIAMVQNNEQGRAIRKYFIQVEKELRQMGLPSYMIDDPVKRAEKWITERKEYESLKDQQKLDQPFTSFGKIVSNSNGAISIGAFAKMMYDKHGINIGRNKLFDWLREKGYLIKSGRERNNPKQQFLEQGLFEVKATIVSRTQGDVETLTTLITGKGQVKLAELLVNEYKAVI